MLDALLNVLAWALLSAAALLAVGVMAAFRSPSRGLLSFFQHFAARMILAAVGFRDGSFLVADSADRIPPVPTIGGRSPQDFG